MSESLEAWINPLQILNLDEPWATTIGGQVTAETFFEFLCTPSVPRDLGSLEARYREISIERTPLFGVPFEAGIMNRLVWPLRHAKAAYSVGNYLATIALAGIVAEMMALLLWDVFGSAELEESDSLKRELGGRTFERADQARRVKVLRLQGLADSDEVQAYNRIRVGRREHLHLWSEADTTAVAKTAVSMFDDAVFLVHRGLGLGFKNGALTMKGRILQYIKAKKTEGFGG